MKRKRLPFLALLLALCAAALVMAFTGCSPKVNSVSITNKSELAAEWYVNDYDRELVVKDGEKLLDPSALTVESENADIVSVDGLKLRPLSVGTTTVTVKADGHSDKIRLQVKARTKKLEIANKDALTDYWKVGDADRTVEIAVAPDKFKPNEVEFTVESDNEGVISASKHTLRAISTGTATITVKSGDCTDKLTIKVSPEIKSVAIANKTELSEAWNVGETRKVAVTLDPSDKFNDSNTKIKIEASDKNAIRVNGLEITPLKSGEFNLTVSVGDKNDSAEVSFALVAPQISVANNKSKIELLAGEKVKMPEITASTCYGTDITDRMEITLSSPDKMLKQGNKLTVDEIGSYTITYRVSDPLDDNITAELVLPVNVYRNILSKYNTADVLKDTTLIENSKYVADEEQKMQTTHGGNGVSLWAKFNLEPSKLYYAEATFAYPDYSDGDFFAGMGHYLKDNTVKRCAVGAMDLGATNVNWTENNFYLRDYNIIDGANIKNSHELTGDTPGIRIRSLSRTRELFDISKKIITVQSARSGDTFYYFVNGCFIGAAQYDYFTDKDTIPGIFGFKMVDNGVGVKEMSNIRYFAGEEAQRELDKLLYENENSYGLITPYVFGTHTKDETHVNEFYQSRNNKVETGKNEQRGVHFDYTKNDAGYLEGSVSPNLFFEKDFTFEWDYKHTEATQEGANMQFQLRTRLHDGLLLQFGLVYKDGGASLVYRNRTDTVSALEDVENAEFTTALASINDTAGVKFKVSRKLYTGENAEDNYALITVTVSSIADSAQTFTKTFKFDYTDLGGAKWNQAVTLNWLNVNLSGEYSNIKWTYTTDEVSAEPVALSDGKRKTAD